MTPSLQFVLLFIKERRTGNTSISCVIVSPMGKTHLRLDTFLDNQMLLQTGARIGRIPTRPEENVL